VDLALEEIARKPSLTFRYAVLDGKTVPHLFPESKRF